MINEKDAEIFKFLRDITVIEPTSAEADNNKSDDDFKIVFVSVLPKEEEEDKLT